MQYDNCEKQTELKNEVEDCKEKQSQQNGNDQTPAKKRNLFWIKGPLSVLSALLASISSLLAFGAIVLGSTHEEIILGLFCFFVALSLIVLTTIFGIQAIIYFARNKNTHKANAVISLIFGIAGLIILLYPIFFVFSCFILFRLIFLYL